MSLETLMRPTGEARAKAVEARAAQLTRLNAPADQRPVVTTYNRDAGSVVSQPAGSVLPAATPKQLTGQQQINARADAADLVPGSKFAEQLGLTYSNFCSAVRAGFYGKPITRGQNMFFQADDVKRHVARRTK